MNRHGLWSALAHALAGWALCGVTIGAGRALTTLGNALIIHAVAAPIIFAALSFHYSRRPGAWTPLGTAATFLGVAVFLDVFVVALFIERSFEMFRSPLGTWLPFLLIFVSTWGTATAVHTPGTGSQKA